MFRVRALLTSVLLGFTLALPAASASAAKATKPAKSTQPAKPRIEYATFAMGCFWCGETQFETLPGVKSVISGYTGGTEANPSYEQVGSHGTGHFEAVQITFDPSVTSYESLLDLFWHGIDPTQADGQFCDIGPQYRAAIFGHNARQLELAEASRKGIEASGVLKQPIVTEIRPAGRFWPAESYHQDFWKKDNVRYCTYREGCGRDQRLAEVWGDRASKPAVH